MITTSIRVEGQDQAGEARRRTAAVASAAGLDETTAGRAAIVVTELANNLWKHAGGGEILVSYPSSQGPCIEILSLDNGPGMADVVRCFQDGYSTAGSSGTGLGAVQRLSSQHDVYSVPGKGTVILARLQPPGAKHGPAIEVGGVSVPMRGETVCGDAFAFSTKHRANLLLVVDGLGHGPGAADCADAAVAAFRESELEDPVELMRELHAALRATRGAAVSVARIDFAGGQLRYSGVGNIAGVICEREARPRHLLSHPGIVGHDCRNVREVTYELPGNGLVLLYSDGISTHWSLGPYEGLLSRDPSLIAGVIYRDHSRGRDDATVVVVRSGLS